MRTHLVLPFLFLTACASGVAWPPLDPLGHMPAEQARLVQKRFSEARAIALAEDADTTATTELLLSMIHRIPSSLLSDWGRPSVIEVRRWDAKTLMLLVETRQVSQFSNQAIRTVHVFEQSSNGAWLEVARLQLGIAGWIQ